jgi:TIR domain-containing protein
VLEGKSMPNFKYDVFISYQRKDAPWAEKLERDLLAKGLKVFRDVSRIRLGDDWNRELLTSVRESQHLILLWSDLADRSQWVTHERSLFFVINAERKASDPTRRLIAVTLEGSTSILAGFQNFNDLSVAGSYASGAAAVDPAIWSRLVIQLDDAVRASRTTLPIATLVFTITQAALGAMNPGQKAPWGSSLEDLLKDLGVGGPNPAGTRRDLLLPYYGAKRSEWKPFGQEELPIGVLLDKAFTALNQRLTNQNAPPEMRFHMEWIDDDFFEPDPAARENYLARMRQNLTLLVIDVVPLFDWSYQWYFEELAQCLANDLAAVVVLPPFRTAQESARLHQFLQKAVKNFATFYHPPIPAPAKYAHFGLSANDDGDIGRLIQRSVGYYLRSSQSSPAVNPFLAMGT